MKKLYCINYLLRIYVDKLVDVPNPFNYTFRILLIFDLIH